MKNILEKIKQFLLERLQLMGFWDWWKKRPSKPPKR